MGTHTKRKTYLLICEHCFEMFIGKKYNTRFCSEKCKRENYIPPKRYIKICPQCEKEYKTHYKPQKFCAMSCFDEYQREQAKKHFLEVPDHIATSRRARHEYRRRKLKRENFVEVVKLEKLLERDQGICQLCQEAVRLDVDYRHPKAPTIDHIIALANGGEHSYANTQLACRQCNSKKSDKEVLEYVQTKQKREGSAS